MSHVFRIHGPMLAGVGLIACLTLAPGPSWAQETLREDLARCRQSAADSERLACYDRLAAQPARPRWSGRLSFSTEPFRIERPTLLRFESEGVILVMALKDGTGEVVQNLHHAGAGEGSYLIARPGLYSLEINGAEGWRVWLEPRP